MKKTAFVLIGLLALTIAAPAQASLAQPSSKADEKITIDALVDSLIEPAGGFCCFRMQ